MKRVRIWSPESDTDSKAIECLANKIIKFHEIEISISKSTKSAYNQAARADDGLEKAVNIYLKHDDFVIFLLDRDGTQTNAQRKTEPNSHINKITKVINQIPEKTKLLYMCQELEAWLLIDCLGICCYFKDNETIREDQDWIKFSKKHQIGKTDLIVEAEMGGSNAKESLVKFSHKIIQKINPKIKSNDIAKKEYTESISDRVAKFINTSEETLNRNDSLKEFARCLCEIAKLTEEKTP
jgi:hypothetical protein